ncbi:MAG: DNA-directed RNA polymerase subunit beta, partial [Defluviitaleaceae bacterium]|nr:DNA-directed RNA polymerase subunit beta [Defluviitaleaceae bacterium]
MENRRVKSMSYGKAERKSYSRIDEVLEMPNLIEVQKNSYDWFLNEGLREVFQDISPISDFSGNLVLEFVDFKLDNEPKYSIDECKERDATYAAPLRVKCRLRNKELDEIKEQEIFMGDFPLMTDNCTFIINGAERVIVSQLVRSPGIYYSVDYDKVGKQLFSATVIPNRGAWLEYETDSNDIFNIRVDRTRKVPVTVLLRSLGVSTDAEIIELFGEEPKILNTIEKDISKNYEEGLIEIYKRVRPGEPPTIESAESLLRSMFFDPKRYDLAKVGRYKFNQKLAMRNRIRGFYLAEDVIDTFTGEVVAEAGDKVTAEIADAIQNSGVGFAWVQAEDRKVKVLSNMAVLADDYLKPYGINAREAGIKESVYAPVLMELLEKHEDPRELQDAIRNNLPRLVPKHITLEDIMASISYI